MNAPKKLFGQAVLIGWLAALTQAAEPAGSYPRLVTAETKANPKALADLERPGKVVFQDDFESSASLKKYFEIRGLQDGRAKLVSDAKLAHSGKDEHLKNVVHLERLER